jgi:GNAT superfamily N-acetyltransferase
VRVLALGVLPTFRRRGLAARLLRTAATELRVLATNAPQVPTALITAHTATRVCVDVARADGSAREFWKHVGLNEEDTPRREPWSVGWRDVVSVAGPVSITA